MRAGAASLLAVAQRSAELRRRRLLDQSAGWSASIRRSCGRLITGRRHRSCAETERFRRFTHGELARNRVISTLWLKDGALEDHDLLASPDEIAAETVENLEAVLDRFRKVAMSLQPS
jgi:hypothetical protein